VLPRGRICAAPHLMPQWLRPSTRWAIYLRDDLSCVYCQTTMRAILDSLTPDNFLTIDHLRARSKGGSTDARNLVTACYDCNLAKGTGNLKEFCEARGLHYHRTRAYMLKRRNRNLDDYRYAARLVLGHVPGFPRAEAVRLHDWLARSQWALDAELWETREMFCPECGRPDDEVALGAEGVPF